MTNLGFLNTYETDYHQWTIEQADALRKFVHTHQELTHLDQLDWDNIIEENENSKRPTREEKNSFSR